MKNKHIYSTFALIALIAIALMGAISALTSKDIDQICTSNNSFLYKRDGIWSCFNTQYDDILTPITISKTGLHAPIFDENEKTYYMDKPTSTADEDYIFFAMQLPHGYKVGTNISCHMHAYTKIKENNNITFEMNYSWYNIGESNWDTYVITKNVNISTINNTNMIISFGNIDGTNKGISSTMKGRIKRVFTGSSTQNIYIDFFDCHYQIDSFGSNSEYTK